MGFGGALEGRFRVLAADRKGRPALERERGESRWPVSDVREAPLGILNLTFRHITDIIASVMRPSGSTPKRLYGAAGAWIRREPGVSETSQRLSHVSKVGKSLSLEVVMGICIVDVGKQLPSIQNLDLSAKGR
ncbi:6527_t:CDS:2, partial [Acaulospora colombiana]